MAVEILTVVAFNIAGAEPSSLDVGPYDHWRRRWEQCLEIRITSRHCARSLAHWNTRRLHISRRQWEHQLEKTIEWARERQEERNQRRRLMCNADRLDHNLETMSTVEVHDYVVDSKVSQLAVFLCRAM